MPTVQGLKPINKKTPWVNGWEMGDVETINNVSNLGNTGAGIGAFAGDPSMGADDISGRFDASYEKAAGLYDPFPGDHSKIDQLQDLYGTVGESYDVSDTLSALGATRKTNLLTGEQAANTAARKFGESSIPGASSGVGSSMIRAQALLPFLQQDTAAAGEERKYADSAKQDALKTASGIATTLAELQQSYTNSLASYNSSKANFGINYAGQQSDLALNASQGQANNQLEAWKVAAQIAESQRRDSQQQSNYEEEFDLRKKATAVSAPKEKYNGAMGGGGMSGTNISPEYAAFLKRNNNAAYGYTGY